MGKKMIFPSFIGELSPVLITLTIKIANMSTTPKIVIEAKVEEVVEAKVEIEEEEKSKGMGAESIRRMMMVAGAEKISAGVPDMIEKIVEKVFGPIVEKISIITEYMGRTTISEEDVEYGLGLSGLPVYGKQLEFLPLYLSNKKTKQGKINSYQSHSFSSTQLRYCFVHRFVSEHTDGNKVGKYACTLLHSAMENFIISLAQKALFLVEYNNLVYNKNHYLTEAELQCILLMSYGIDMNPINKEENETEEDSNENEKEEEDEDFVPSADEAEDTESEAEKEEEEDEDDGTEGKEDGTEKEEEDVEESLKE